MLKLRVGLVHEWNRDTVVTPNQICRSLEGLPVSPRKAFRPEILEKSPSFEKIVSAFDGYGECVEDPKEMIPALKRGLKAVREEKRQAVLNVICKYPV